MSEINSRVINQNLNQSINAEFPIFYKYARFGILAQNIVMLPLLGWCIWYTVTYQTMTIKQILIVLGGVFFLIMGLRTLIRLSETIIVTQDGVSRKTWSNETHILWNEVTCIKKYRSWLERYCYKIESESGNYITVSEMLGGYAELYKTLENNVSPSKFAK
jgi:hypothetical protein